jgi:hypothetical protein
VIRCLRVLALINRIINDCEGSCMLLSTVYYVYDDDDDDDDGDANGNNKNK